MDYESIKKLAVHYGYASFTALQEDTFSNAEAFSNQNLFVIGQTSTGKTLIPVLLYAQALREAEEAGEPTPKMLFAVPYRALAAQKLQELCEFFQGQGLHIVQSTGEFRQDDVAIMKAQVDIAVIITEKAFKYQARDERFFAQYDYLVLDEVGLVDSTDRGVRLDFVFAWAYNSKRQYGRPRTVALATPFYDWSAYVNSYDFLTVCREDRPVKLKETDILYKKYSILDTGGCDFLRPTRMESARRVEQIVQKYGERASLWCDFSGKFCLTQEPARTDRRENCPFQFGSCVSSLEYVPEGCAPGRQYILLKICREHLRKGHQILIFINDREQVKILCKFLYQQLRDLLPTPPETKECRNDILGKSGLEEEDVFGILESDDGDSLELEFYEAFTAGVGFHSAALPNELRTYVEDRFLNSQEMQIVCSTETLAFGVNSAVDVVILADLKKHDGVESRFLTMNEFRNYAGRAGRMKQGLNPEEALGYVYTLIPQGSKEKWDEIRRSEATPEQLHSRLLRDDGQQLAFFMLNMLPNNDSIGMTVQELAQLLVALPQDGSTTADQLHHKVESALKFLCEQELATISHTRSRGRRASDEQKRYCLTVGQGSRLRGFSIGKDDYIQILQALREYSDRIFADPDNVTFLYRLLQTKHVVQGLNNVYSKSETRLSIPELRDTIRSRASAEHELAWLDSCNDEKVLSILAAILAWGNGESAKSLYRQYGIHYALLDKIADQIGYLIEIAVEVLPFHMEKIWEKKTDVYSRMKLDMEMFTDQVSKKCQKLHDLFISVYFGVNTQITREYLEFLLSKQEPEAQNLAQKLSLEFLNPKSARELRKLAMFYLFFAKPPAVDRAATDAWLNYSSQRRQYQLDVKNKMGPYAEEFFLSRFPAFSD